jgi:hypothetical protein
LEEVIMSEQPQAPQQPTPPERYPYRTGEKDEKDTEKRDSQREKEEKNYEEKWRRDPVSAVGWAVFLVWTGLVFLGFNVGFLVSASEFGPWGLIAAGAGVILLFEAAVRLSVPQYRRPVVGTVIFGVILLAVGLGGLGGNWNYVWPVVLIVFGLAILMRGLFRR